MSGLAAVVVRWRGGDEVRRCLQSILDHAGPRLSRIVLVDSASGDGGAARLGSQFPAVEVLELERNLGFAHAANSGAASGDEDLLLLNPDTELTAGAVEQLLKILDDRPRAAAAVPLLHGIDGGSQHRWQLRSKPTPFRLATGRPGAPAFASSPKVPVWVPQPAAAAWLVRREVWTSLKGFDETYVPAWWEDVDFCGRLESLVGRPESPWSEGFVVVPDARVGHIGGSSVRSLSDETFLTTYYLNLLRYAAAHHAENLALIKTGLDLTLRARMLVRPSRASGYRAALRAIKKARLEGPGSPPPPAAAG